MDVYILIPGCYKQLGIQPFDIKEITSCKNEKKYIVFHQIYFSIFSIKLKLHDFCSEQLVSSQMPFVHICLFY